MTTKNTTVAPMMVVSAVALGLAACGSSGGGPNVKLDLPANYGGLGATKAAFDAQNDVTPTPRPVLGIATYRVDATNAVGRVTAFSVQINAQPPMSNVERMFLVQGIDFPNDRRPVKDGSTCAIIESRTLERMIGKRYARVTTVTGSDEASIEATSSPTC